MLVGAKHRTDDRDVIIAIGGIRAATGRRVVLVDDVIASGATQAVAARLLVDGVAATAEAVATHRLANDRELAALKLVRIIRARATDSVLGPVADIPLPKQLA